MDQVEIWSVPTGPSDSLSVSRTEDYAYDYAARLSAWDNTTDGENLSYDERGNITSRAPRHGQGATVTLTYTGDRLATRKEGTGAAVPFAHDAFARVTTDAESGLSIAYNALDLPESISQGTTLKARYSYLSDGTKVSAQDATGAGLVYRGPFTYRRNAAGTLTFESAAFEGGRLTEAGPRYFVTDHLGSVRAVIDGIAASTTTYPPAGFFSIDDYAPYGTKSTSSASSYLSLATSGSTVSLRDSFTGQEDQGPDFGLPYIDYDARQYSPSLSRWLVPDPMGEKYYDVSPYVYCAGNPVILVDPDGRGPIVGALLGAGLDVGIQITTNIIKGEKWNKIDKKSVMISAGTGALGVGIVSKVKQAKTLVGLGKTAVTTAEVLTEAAVSGFESATKQLVSTGTVSLEQTAIDATVGAAASGAGKYAKNSKRVSTSGRNELNVLERQLDHAERVAGNNPRPSRQAKVEAAKTKVENYGNIDKDKAEAGTSFMLSVVETIYEEDIQNK